MILTVAVVFLVGCQVSDKSGLSDKNDDKTEAVAPPKKKDDHTGIVAPPRYEESAKPSEDGTDSGPVLNEQYFNEVKEVDGKLVIQNPDNLLALVNKQYALPEDYVPSDLVRPNVPFSFGNLDIEKAYLRKEAAEKLEAMFAAARADGIQLYAVSGYRSYQRQAQLFEIEVQKVGREAAELVVAFPGNSEHQSGLAMDISGASIDYVLTENFADTPEGRWLAENAHKYGFILRYPKGKENITGYSYEPWHFRYVGEEVAAIIYEKGITLEEYFEIVQKI